MAIDKGPSVTKRYINLGYISPIINGYVWTEKGIQFINDTLAELYNINSNDIHDLPINDSGGQSKNTSGIQSEQE